MGASGGASHYAKIALVLLILAFILHLIAIAAPWWASTDPNMTDREEHIGLWKHCTWPVGGGESCTDFVDVIYGGMSGLQT